MEAGSAVGYPTKPTARRFVCTEMFFFFGGGGGVKDGH